MSAWDAIDELLHASVGSVFSAAQLVVLDGGVPAFATAVGEADDRTVFDLASLTKPLVTATLIAGMIDRGTLALDDVVTIAAGRCTARALLSHSSGLPAHRVLGDPLRPDRDAVLAAVHATPFEYEPGTKSIYSDLGFLLLGELVEQRFATPIDVAFAARIAQPLELALTYHPDATRCAPTRDDRRGAVDDDNARAMHGIAGHAGLFGTAREVSRYVAQLIAIWHGDSDKDVVRPATLRQFWSHANIPSSTWCLGWDRPSPRGSSAGERWPKSGVGHLGFTGTSIWIDPPRRRAVVFLTNRVHLTNSAERIKQLRPQLHDLIVKLLDDRSP